MNKAMATKATSNVPPLFYLLSGLLVGALLWASSGT